MPEPVARFAAAEGKEFADGKGERRLDLKALGDIPDATEDRRTDGFTEQEDLAGIEVL
jgi:hypothetical protein